MSGRRRANNNDEDGNNNRGENAKIGVWERFVGIVIICLYLIAKALTQTDQYLINSNVVNAGTSGAFCPPAVDLLPRAAPPLDVLDEIDILSGGPQAKDLECPPPLVAFQNVIVRMPSLNNSTSTSGASTSTEQQQELIPKMMHFSFKSRCLPQDLFANLDKWRKILPDHSIFFHDDEAVERLSQQDWLEFPELKRAMKCIRYKGAMKIDVWRVLLLYKHGGIYSDIDVVPGRYLGEQTIRLDLSFFSFVDAWMRPSQWFMATEPRHPIMTLAMLQITQNLLAMKKIRTPKLVFVTGPHVVKSAWHQFISMGPNNYTDYWENNFEYEGAFNKKVLKHQTNNFVSSKDNYKDIVTLYNSTTEVTRQERIEHESGVVHWTKKLWHQEKRRKIKGEEKDISCRAYLKELKSGSIELLSDLD